MAKPKPDVEINTKLVESLVREQHPTLARLPIREVTSGWDNKIFKLGTQWSIRMPRRRLGNLLLQIEREWLPKLAPTLPIAIPKPVFLGDPSQGYPYHWHITAWFEGKTGLDVPAASSQIPVLSNFLKALHQKAPQNFPLNEYRGVPLSRHLEKTRQRIQRSRSRLSLDWDKLIQIWKRGQELPVPAVKRVIHGDLHAQNVILQNRRMTAVIDWGDLCQGDCATDLVSVWSLFQQKSERQRFWKLYQPDPELMCRAMAWACFFGFVLVDAGASSPVHEHQGVTLLTRVCEDR